MLGGNQSLRKPTPNSMLTTPNLKVVNQVLLSEILQTCLLKPTILPNNQVQISIKSWTKLIKRDMLWLFHAKIHNMAWSQVTLTLCLEPLNSQVVNNSFMWEILGVMKNTQDHSEMMTLNGLINGSKKLDGYKLMMVLSSFHLLTLSIHSPRTPLQWSKIGKQLAIMYQQLERNSSSHSHQKNLKISLSLWTTKKIEFTQQDAIP